MFVVLTENFYKNPLLVGKGVGCISLYNFIGNSVVSGYDVLGLFQDGGCGKPSLILSNVFSGHLDFANFCICPFDYTLADYKYMLFIPFIWEIKNHFLEHEDPKNRVDDAIDKCDANLFELAMHWLQDYQTHRAKGYVWEPFNFEAPCWGFGHICDGSKPDLDK